jgi:hypothetical protein
MRKGRDLNHDLDRLVAATSMYARQQAERATYGDDDDYDDAKDDSHRVVAQVLDTLEKHLDEDFVEQLDRGEYPRTASMMGCWPRMPEYRSTWPYWNYYSNANRSRVASRRLVRGAGRTHDMLDEILEDFRNDFEDRLRKARRDDRPMSEAEMDEALQGLRQDLSVVVRRARRREDRDREEDESFRRSRTQ